MRPIPDWFLSEHLEVTRRWLLAAGAAGVAAIPLRASGAENAVGREANVERKGRKSESSTDASPVVDPVLQKAIDGIESYMTRPDDFRDVSRGDPKPHSLDEEKRRAVGLTRDTWKLELISDPDNPATLGREMTQANGAALDFDGLMRLAEKHAVRIPKVMTCLNIGCPLGMGIWEGVPMRDVLWMAEPRENLRRVFFYGYHNDDAKQMFRSSLPVGRILEDLYDLPPVILAYRLNGEWLTPERGGPVRVIVPEGYGFKSIKWLTTMVLSNLPHANDTYANGNNDLDSPLKTFAGTLSVPSRVAPNTPFAVTGWAQVGVSGLSKVQVWIHNDDEPLPDNDPYFQTAPWTEAAILPPPDKDEWGGDLPGDAIPAGTIGFEEGRPATWPMKLAKVHWATLIPGLPVGRYTFRSRTIDARGHAQPMPRPFRKSGNSVIEEVRIGVKE